MPPVLRPVSPSPARLWSCADDIILIVFPSTNESTETSRPVMNSSTTIVFPAVPNFLSSMMVLTPSFASSRVLQISTPFPRASPSAFNTIGNFAVSKYLSASLASVKFSYAAVGILYFFMRSFENAFEPSRIAAFFFGPKHLSPAFSNSSTIPPTSGSSMPMIVKSMALSFANDTSLSNSIAPIGTHSASAAIPALPGAQYILSTRELFATALHIACSLPPLPTTNTFIFASYT